MRSARSSSLSGTGCGSGAGHSSTAWWCARLSEHRGPPAAAAALYAEDAEGKRLRERLADQLRVAPSLRYEGKGRPTKKERREIEKLRGE